MIRAIALSLLLTVPPGLAQAGPLESIQSGWKEFSTGERIALVGFGAVVVGMAGTGLVVFGTPAAVAAATGAATLVPAGLLTAMAGHFVMFAEGVISTRAREREDARLRAERGGFNGGRPLPPPSLRRPAADAPAGAGMSR